MSSTNLKVRSGNRIKVLFDGQQVGLIDSVRMDDDYSPEPASGIGDIHVVEYVPTMARHTVHVTNMVLNAASLRSLNIHAENGDDVLKGRVFDFEVYDKDSGVLLRKYVNCSYARGGIDTRKHAIVVASGDFMALDVTGAGV